MKFRIVYYIHKVNEVDSKNSAALKEYVIEKKSFIGFWKEVFHKEISNKRVSHKTYEEAELYLFSNYMGHGECKKINNEYHYKPYTYYV